MFATAVALLTLAIVLYLFSGLFLTERKTLGRVLALVAALLSVVALQLSRTSGINDAIGKVAGPIALEEGKVYKVIGHFERSNNRWPGVTVDDGTGVIFSIFEWNLSPKAQLVKRVGDKLVEAVADATATMPATAPEKLPPIPEAESDGGQ